jgi:hypothetical protein
MGIHMVNSDLFVFSNDGNQLLRVDSKVQTQNQLPFQSAELRVKSQIYGYRLPSCCITQPFSSRSSISHHL